MVNYCNMNSIRKWIFAPKKSDKSLLAQFYFSDDELNAVSAELESFDGKKEQDRCLALVNKLRHCQEVVISVLEKIMAEEIPNQRASRDFRVKFSDELVVDSLGGQLWFGAECLAAGSSIMHREVESASMRPLAKLVTKRLDDLRCQLREQCLKNPNVVTDEIRSSLAKFDKVFAEFELSYVSAMVPVKTMKELELQQEVAILFCETVQRALRLDLLTLEMIEMCEPALMLTIPRLAIMFGLLIQREGPLNPDIDPTCMSEMFRPFQTLLYKIRELLRTLNEAELSRLERSLCVNHNDTPTSTLPSPPFSTEADVFLPKPSALGSTHSSSSTTSSSTGSCDSLPAVLTLCQPSLDSEQVAGVEQSLEKLLLGGVVTSDTRLCDDDDDNDDDDSSGRCTMIHSESNQTVQSRGSDYSQDIITDCNTTESTKHDAGSPSKHETSESTKHDTAKHDTDSPVQCDTCPANPKIHDCETSDHIKHSSELLKYDMRASESITHDSAGLCVTESTKLDNAALSPGAKMNSEGSINAHNNVNTEAVNSDNVNTEAVNSDNMNTEAVNSDNNNMSRSEILLNNTTNRHLHHSVSWPQQSVASEGRSVMDTITESLGLEEAEGGGRRSADSCRGVRSVRTMSRLCSAEFNFCLPSITNETFPLDESVTSMDEVRQHADHSETGLANSESDAGIDCIAGGSDRTINSRNVESDCNAISSSLRSKDISDSGVSNTCAPESRRCDDTVTCSDSSSVVTSINHCSDNSAHVSSSTIPSDTIKSSEEIQGDLSAQCNNQPELDSEQNNNISTDDLGVASGTSETLNISDNVTDGDSDIYEDTLNEVVDYLLRELTRSDQVMIIGDNSRADLQNGVQCQGASAQPCTDSDDNSTDSSSNTSSFSQDGREIAMAIQAAEEARRLAARSHFRSSSDLIHRLFVCISGVADQLQTNYAADLRYILKIVFEYTMASADEETVTSPDATTIPADGNSDQDLRLHSSEQELGPGGESAVLEESELARSLQYDVVECEDIVIREGGLIRVGRAPRELVESVPLPYESVTRVSEGREQHRAARQQARRSAGHRPEQRRPQWVPDDVCSACMSCKVSFTFMRRRHHCRNCGKIFCGRCTSNMMPLPQLGHVKPVRVCHHCFLFRVTPFTIDSDHDSI